MSDLRYLLCRPRGGLNDSLCQVEACWRYADRFQRVLIVDTLRSGLFTELSNFFEPRAPKTPVIFSSSATRLLGSAADCMPREVAGLIDTYTTAYSPALRNHVDAASQVQLTFDFTADHAAEVLLHEQCGGGPRSFDFLRRVDLSVALKTILRARLRFRSEGYAAIHIRNTDYKTDYMNLFEEVRDKVSGQNLLICSDDANVIRVAKSFLSQANVFSVSDIPDTDQQPIHGAWVQLSKAGRDSSAVDVLVDLFALAFSHTLFTTNVSGGHPSGFSRLAQFLHQDRPLLDRLLPES